MMEWRCYNPLSSYQREGIDGRLWSYYRLAYRRDIVFVMGEMVLVAR